MKKYILGLVSLSILLSGCTNNVPVAEPIEEIAEAPIVEEPKVEEPIKEEPEEELRDIVKKDTIERWDNGKSSIVIEHYNIDGNITKREIFRNDKLTAYQEYSYLNGLESHIEIWNDSASGLHLVGIEEKEYDDSNLCIKRTRTDGEKLEDEDNKLIFETRIDEYEYDEYGNVSKRVHTIYKSRRMEYYDGCVHTYKNYYDENNRLIKVISESKWDSDDMKEFNKTETIDYSYNELGQLICEGNWQYEYDENGSVVKITNLDYQTTYEYEYEYDEKGRILHKVEKEEDKRILEETHSYEFY